MYNHGGISSPVDVIQIDSSSDAENYTLPLDIETEHGVIHVQADTEHGVDHVQASSTPFQ